MKTLAKIVGALVLVLALLATGVLGLSESGEVVVLETSNADGSARRTRLWIVDADGHAWLRAGQPGSPWLANLLARPEVSLERGDATARYRAVPVSDAAALARLHALMAEKYGLADRVTGLMRDASASTPIRLDPLPPAP